MRLSFNEVKRGIIKLRDKALDTQQQTINGIPSLIMPDGAVNEAVVDLQIRIDTLNDVLEIMREDL